MLVSVCALLLARQGDDILRAGTTYGGGERCGNIGGDSGHEGESLVVVGFS